MARFMAAAPQPQDRRSAMTTEGNKTSVQADRYGEDPFALTEGSDYPPPSKTVENSSGAIADGKLVDDDDDIAIPTPIATLVFQDGRTEPVYKPLAGHEHLFKARPLSSSQTSFAGRASGLYRTVQPAQVHHTETLQCHAPEPSFTSELQKKPVSRRQKRPLALKQGLLKSKSLKRTRSTAQGLAPNPKPEADRANEETVQVVTEESITFYIGDVEAFKDFLRRRFDELTMKPLRGIVTHWVKLLEPRRLGDWGKYHEMLPSEADTPPWWPRTVIYKEPSHLKKSELSTLAVEMMLVHREIDEIKRKSLWISKLREVAKFTVQTTSADHFSSSKGAVHSEEMKKRALDQILPSIFEVAQAYEDHIMQYNLFEGSGNKDPGRGKHHTWKAIPRPARRQHLKRPRRTMESSPAAVDGTVCEGSGDETEPDDTMVKLARAPRGLPQIAPSPQTLTAQGQAEVQSRRQSKGAEETRQQLWKVETPASSSGPCTPVTSQDDCRMHRTVSTPSSSFDQSLHGLHLGEEQLDMKPTTRTMSDHGYMHTRYDIAHYNQPVQYAAAQTSYDDGQSYQPADNYTNSPGLPTFTQHGPGFVNPFNMFNAPQTPMGYTQYGTPLVLANGYAYEQGVFPSTPMSMPMAPSDSAAFHGLPCDYPVDPQGLQQF